MRKLIRWFKGREILEVITVDPSKGTIEFRDPSWQIRPIVAWYDFWIGIFIDREKRRVYLFPIPCVGIVIFWG